ncbi:hypothetical protein C2845_PM02G36440 [Panicum miliaceum]|uniref:KIB1-4 beta-propeller domain-containing protein n=1 Tax=Panicum miliaceum TaxID=4540 RepID=A0A3L6SA51_PANMI|nr:hypothetical protein C2845_PM02G36440 [Panicum miliaceum]
MARKAAALAPATAARKRKGGWASLPSDLTLLVAWRVLGADVVDYIAFRGACSGWRACTPSPRDPTLRNYWLRPRRWVALCGGDAVRPDDAGEITFLHTRTARCLRGRRLHRRLLVLLHKRDTTVRVLHPFTRAAVDLPPPVYHEVVRNRNSLLDMRAAVCAASATSIAVVVWFPWTPGVLCAVPFRHGWEVIHKEMKLGNTLPFQGRLYGFVRFSRQVVQVYPPNPPAGPLVAHVPDEFGNPFMWHCQYYLVEYGTHMLLVVRHGNVKREGTEPWQRSAFAMFRVDISDRWRLLPVTNLGDQALFLREDRCLSVSAKDLPSISSNSVYFSAPPPDNVIWHSLNDKSFERPTMFCKVHNLKERIRPSVRPFTIADHLLTYCSHREW